MKKRFRWVKIVLLCIALGLTALALLGFTLLKGTPDYYAALAMSPEQREAAAKRAEDTITRMQNLAAAARGAEIKSRESNEPARHRGSTFSFTQDELNALFNKWSEQFGWSNVWGQYLADPMIALRDGKVIFAGRVKLKEIEAVVSFHFKPSIDEKGQLRLDLYSVRGGRLPLPQDATVKPMREKLVNGLASRFPAWQQNAKIDPNGGANDEAMKVAMGRLIVNLLQEKSIDPTVFLPVFQESRRVPATLTDVKVEKDVLSFTVVPMDAPAREELLKRLKQPVNFASLQ